MGPRQDPTPLEYLKVDEPWGLDLELSVRIRPAGADQAFTVSTVNSGLLYWNCAQQLAHLTVNGASLRPGDLFASGTISGEERDSHGCLLEMSENGTRPVTIGADTRSFLEDGDEVILSGWATTASGARVELGEVRGAVTRSGRIARQVR